MGRFIEVNLIFKTPQMSTEITLLAPVASLIDVSIKLRCTTFSQSDVVERHRKLQAEIMNSSCKDGEFQRMPAPGSANLPKLPDRDGRGWSGKAEASYRLRSAQVVERGETTAGCHN